jgi:ribonucrease Y
LDWIVLLAGLVGAGVGATVAYFFLKSAASGVKQAAEAEAARIVENARRDADELSKESKLKEREAEIALKEREKENKERWAELQKGEQRLVRKEEGIDRKSEALDERDKGLTARDEQARKMDEALVKRTQDHEKRSEEIDAKLEEVAGLSRDEARQRMHEALVDAVKHDAAKELRQIEEEAKHEAERRAKKIISTAIMRYSGEYVGERTVSVVHLPNDDMKGRIIGREGRNIKAFESISGIDLIIDNTPEAVILSGYDPVRREVAKISLEKLINDGRIHPSRIEEVVQKTEKEVEQAVKEAGEYAIFELGLHGINPELIRTLGLLKYRMSYAQNILFHSIEVAFITGMMCAELGLDVKLGRRAGLFHDIGKAVDHKIEGPHALIGADLLKKQGENPDVIHAVAAHHEDEKPRSMLAVLVTAADSLSGARPGARREMLESYIARIEKLEAIARDFKGVDKSYAIQAGREVRVIVGSKGVNDDQAGVLSRDIAKKIEDELTYPGQIRVTVIRETRSIAFAK